MARVKRGVIARARHKKILKQAKGYYGARSRLHHVLREPCVLSCIYSKLKKLNVNDLCVRQARDDQAQIAFRNHGFWTQVTFTLGSFLSQNVTQVSVLRCAFTRIPRCLPGCYQSRSVRLP